jgi:mevalonate pyrophosphate decarboxylase
MANNNSDLASDYGVKPMQVAAPLPGSNGSIQQNNTAMTNQANQAQIKARFGGSKGGAVTVPPVQINYRETGVGNTSTNGNVAAVTRAQSDLYAAKEFDSQVGQKAGKRRSYSKSKKLTGGWPAWGCMSGGKKHKRKSHKRKSHKRKSHRRRSYKKR